MIPATNLAKAFAGAECDDLLTRKEASAFLAQFGIRMKPETLARLWSTGGDGPPCLHIRSKPFYPRRVLRDWALSQIGELRTSEAETAKGAEKA